MNLTPLVPEKTYAVCTNGIVKGQIIVGSQTTTKTQDNRFIATQFDKPTNFKCKYLGILIALVGGFIAAMLATGVGTLIAGILIATVIAAALTYGIGGAVCSFCLKSAEWSIVHPLIKIEGHSAIIGKSQLICTPLFLPSGVITLYYSEEVASRVARITAIKNITEMFAAAGLGAAIQGLGSVLSSVYSYSLMASGSIAFAETCTLGAFIGLYKGGELMSTPINYIENEVSDFLAGVDSTPDEVNSDAALGNAPADILDPFDQQGVYNTTKAKRLKEYNIGSKSPIMKDAWAKVKADPTYSPQTRNALLSKYLKETHAEYKQLNNKLATKNAIGKLIKNNLIMMGFSSGVNILSSTITKRMQKDLEAMIEDAESEAIRKIKIYETQI